MIGYIHSTTKLTLKLFHPITLVWLAFFFPTRFARPLPFVKNDVYRTIVAMTFARCAAARKITRGEADEPKQEVGAWLR